jgi:hypothetical protein
MRAMLVVVTHILGRDLLEMMTTEDEEPIGALSADGAHESLGERVRSWRSNGVLIILIPSLRSTSSKLVVNFVSRSRIRNLNARGAR